MRCEECNVEAEYAPFVNGRVRQLCAYHYWKTGRIACNEQWWKEYRKMHPVRVSRWRKIDPELDAILRKMEVAT